MTPTSLLSLLLLLALGVAANPVVVDHSLVSLPLVRKLNLTSAHNLVRHDQARARALRDRASERSSAAANGTNERVTNQAVTYVAEVGVGDPVTNYSLVVDTGSSNTWVGANLNKPYVKTKTGTPTPEIVRVTYGSGFFSGAEFIDTVTITPSLVVQAQSIGVALLAHGFSGVDGILGIGPVDLTADTLTPPSLIPTVTGNLFKQGTIPDNLIGIFFAPTTQESVENGLITWGGTDSSKFTGPITFTPITNTSPALGYWGIDQSISYGETPILNSTAGIVDTGTTLILIATDAFNLYQKATGAVMDNTTELLCITPAQYENLRDLSFNIGGVDYTLTPNAQIWPRSLNTALGGKPESIYLIVSDIGDYSGSGLDFINGYSFLERFYSVYDTANKQVGFATTHFTDATTN